MYARSTDASSQDATKIANLASLDFPKSTSKATPTEELRTDGAAPLGLSVETNRNQRWQILHEIGCDSCHFLEHEDVDEINAAADELVYSIDLMLDSGAADHVINNVELPQHPLTQPARQRNFVTASGDRIPGKG